MPTHEIDEWRHSVAAMTDTALEIGRDSHRAALGVVGEAGDDL